MNTPSDDHAAGQYGTDLIAAIGAAIESTRRSALDTTRVLIVISVAKGAEVHLPHTVTKLLRQAEKADKSPCLIIGCNAGYTLPADCLEKFAPDVQVLGSTPRPRPGSPGTIVDTTGAPCSFSDASRGRKRITVIRQASGEHQGGKIRMLGDIYAWLADSLRFADSALPAWTLAVDAETELHFARSCLAPTDERGGAALTELLRQMQSQGLDILGTRNRFVPPMPHRVSGRHDPCFGLPAMHRFLNLVHARSRRFSWFPGGGHLMTTPVAIAVMDHLARAFPGLRVEDLALTVCARMLRLRTAFSRQVVSLNEARADTNDGHNCQILRWVSGQIGLARRFGGSQVRKLATLTTQGLVLGCIRAVAAESRQDPKRCLALLRLSIQLSRSLREFRRLVASAQPDDLDYGAATWTV